MDDLNDEKILKQTLNLAKKGLGWTSPNPMVGAVIVKNGQVISIGYHKKAGLPHAEVEAINAASGDIKGATMYVNLEPCSHFGKTPPCVDLIIKSQIKRVVCSVIDPNPKVSGRGITKLKKAGIEVTLGILEDQAKTLNEQFFTFHQKDRPFVAIHFGLSLDGKIATRTGDSKWINNEKAKQFSRKLRGYYQAILVGINTVIVDDPHLGTRVNGFKDPLRIILDPKLKIPLNAQVLRDRNVLIITTNQAPQDKLALLKQKGVNIIHFKEKRILINKLLAKLRELEIISLLVEGGGKTLGSFVDEKLVDKVYAFYGPIIIGGENSLSAVGGEGAEFIKDVLRVEKLSYKHFDDNFLVAGYTSNL